MRKRVLFDAGEQKKFLDTSRKRIGLNWRELSNKLKVNYGTLRKSYRCEYCSLPYNTFSKICNLLNQDTEQTLLKYKAKVIDEIYINRFKFPLGFPKQTTKKPKLKFKNTNFALNTNNVKFSRYDQIKKIKLPIKITPQLAEEVGMQLGDGFLSAKRKEYRLKGNLNEKDYYDNYIAQLFKRLFNLNINLKQYGNAYGFELYSQALWEFKTKTLGIPAGKKNNIRVPEKFKLADVKILCALIRGYFDTDGNVYFKSIYGYENYYPVINVVSASKALIKDYKDILDMLGFKVNMYKTKINTYALHLYGYQNLKRYSELIGWSNPKQRRKVEAWILRYPEICKKIGLRPYSEKVIRNG